VDAGRAEHHGRCCDGRWEGDASALAGVARLRRRSGPVVGDRAYGQDVPAPPAVDTKALSTRSGRALALPVLVGLVLGAALARPLVAGWLDADALQSWATIFVAISVQALPFLVLGVVVSGAIAAYVPPSALARALPARPVLAVPVAAAAGVALPGCECGSVPIAGRLVARGVAPAAAVTFLLSAPAVNPVVLVATAVAFPGQPKVVLARFLASMIAACVVGFVWIVKGRDEWVAKALRNEREEGSRFGTFVETAQHDFLHAGGFLVIGAATAASLHTFVPRSVLDRVADRGAVGVLALAGLAVILAICSEADAFVAASLTQFSLTARLAFMVVGPMVDVKLVALQAGTFGRRFTSFFAPLTFFVAVGAAVLVGTLLL
jgi:uncharacterized membrane protein YraQ (UPF0718 family)